jgi:methyltransferase (TIGR00027 family)
VADPPDGGCADDLIGSPEQAREQRGRAPAVDMRPEPSERIRGYRVAMGFDWAYRNGAPAWDIGRAQPVVERLAEAGAFAGSVIDLGCGTGENALYLAARGVEVTGVDAAPTAIARAQEKAAARGLSATFLVADALALPDLGQAFDAALDCGLFHVLSDVKRVAFERGLRAVLRPGARYFLLCFSDRQPGFIGPRRVSQAEIRATFADGWRVDAIDEARFATQDPVRGPQAPHAWLASLTRLADGDRRPEIGPAPAEPVPVADGLGSERTASSTALGAARLRAAHLLLDDPPPILDDPLAVRLLDPETAHAIHEHPARLRTPVARALRTEVLVRSRHAEDRLADAVERGVRQYVLLGAGLDTFAYRQPAWAAELRIIEVDHAASQRDKQARLRRAGVAVPPNVRYAAADLETDGLGSRLEEAGLDPATPVFVACLGVLIYLSEVAADAIFAWAARLPVDSEFVCTFSRPDTSTEGPPAVGSAAARVAAAGEPWRTRVEPDVMAGRLRAAGFRSVHLLLADDVTRRYLRGRTDGLFQPGRVVIADASV